MLENKPSATWYEKRRLGLGSSEIGVVAGLSSSDYKSKTPFDIAYAKIHGEQEYDTGALYAGRYLERAVLDWAEDQIGEKIDRNRDTREIQLKGLLGLATIDGSVRGKLVVEAKTARSQTESWGDGGGSIPDLYAAQVQWQMGITGMHRALVPTLFKTQDKFVMYELEFDRAFFEMLKTAAEVFWAGTVAIGQLPNPGEEPKKVQQYLRAKHPNPQSREVRMGTSDEYELVFGAIKLRKALDDAELQYEMARAEIQKRIGDGLGFERDGLRAIWSKPTQRVKTDWQKVAEDLAGGDGQRLEQSLLKFTTTFNGGRTLRITERGTKNE